MTLAKNLLNSLSRNQSISESVINESKNEYSGVTLSEFFSLILPTDYLSISLDESENGSVYVDTEVCGLPITFQFHMENEEPKMTVLYNDTSKVVKLSKKVLNENGDFEVDNCVQYLPVEKIESIVEEAIEVSEVMKTVTRLIDGQYKKVKIDVASKNIAKQKKASKLNYNKNKNKRLKQQQKRAERIARVGYTSSELKDINARRKLKGMPLVDKHGNEIK